MSEYLTWNEGEDIIRIGIAFSIFFVIMAFWLYSLTATNNDKDLRAFVASQYNFTEEECVDRGLVSGDLLECNAVTWCRDNFNCSRYCHTEKRQVGEECKVITTGELVRVEYAPDFYVRKLFEEGFTDVILGETAVQWRCFFHDERLCCDRAEYVSGGYYRHRYICEMRINTTICAPVFENISARCESGEVVRRVRQLIGD